MNKALGHLKTINHHKWLVMKGCFAVGLYRQGLLHDLSKYAPVEFLAGCRYYTDGHESPNNGERRDRGYSLAWLHHKGRNRHHFEYWIDYDVRQNAHGMSGMRMPVNYVVEMYVDRVAASKNYQKEAYTNRSALEYYERGKSHYVMHPDTTALLEHLLHKLADEGETATNAYIRRVILADPKHWDHYPEIPGLNDQK